MPSKTTSDLRDRLFAAIDAVKDGTMSVDQAKMVGELAQVIVNTAKVEVDYLRASGGGESAFIDSATGHDDLPEQLPSGITGITRHRLRG